MSVKQLISLKDKPIEQSSCPLSILWLKIKLSTYFIGAFGNVRVCWVKSAPQQKYAIKTMKKADIIKSKHVDHIENEKKILERIEHPFIVS